MSFAIGASVYFRTLQVVLVDATHFLSLSSIEGKQQRQFRERKGGAMERWRKGTKKEGNENEERERREEFIQKPKGHTSLTSHSISVESPFATVGEVSDLHLFLSPSLCESFPFPCHADHLLQKSFEREGRIERSSSSFSFFIGRKDEPQNGSTIRKISHLDASSEDS